MKESTLTAMLTDYLFDTSYCRHYSCPIWTVNMMRSNGFDDSDGVVQWCLRLPHNSDQSAERHLHRWSLAKAKDGRGGIRLQNAQAVPWCFQKYPFLKLSFL